MRPSEVRPIVADHARERLRTELARDGRGARAELARKLGVTKSAITGFLGTRRTPPRGAGEDLLALLAKHWGASPADLEAAALAAAGRGALDPYPNRQEAGRICIEGGMRREAVEQVLDEKLDLAHDPSVLWWIERMIAAAGLLKQPPPAAALPRSRKASSAA